MATIDEPARHRRRGRAREGEEGARVRGQRPVPVLVLGLERGPDDAGRGGVDEDVERAERGDLVGDSLRGDVPAHEHRLGAERRAARPRSPRRRRRRACSRSRRAPRRAPRSGARSPCRCPRDPPVTRTVAPSKLIPARRERVVGRSRRRDRLPAGPRCEARAASPRPATRRGRAGRAAPSAPRRSGAPDGRREGRDQLADAGAQLVREVRRRRADEGVDVVARRLGHRANPTAAIGLACHLP